MSRELPNPESVFAQVIEIDSPEKRAAFLDEACGHDPEFRRALEKLVLDHFRAGNFLENPPAHFVATVEAPLLEKPGTLIGPYKLLEQVGEGGMGLVFVAEQQKPVRRRVALKLIKPGMDSRQVIARFEAERQALALMDHPNIAKVHDGGTTAEGRPYFVMELVKGTPITEYCNQHQLPPRARLELFLDVCQAVQHAHQKGIIHRDLKPSNILVETHDVRPVVKVIDFGIAKAIGQQLSDKTLYTSVAQLIGTPMYMSPEQAGLSSLDVDTRSDVYALGVLLYELLTGTTPFDRDTLKKAAYDEICRIIREEEPPKPSARLSTLHLEALSTIAEQRGLEPRKLGQQLRGELDWIVMKALEKDRNRRYESASAFAADVQRYLRDEPVQACPPSRRYRLGKFLRKHRTGVLTSAAILVLGVGIGWVMLVSAERRAEVEQAVAEDLREAGILQSQDQLAKAAQALERAKGRLEGSGLTALQARVEDHRREVRFVDQIEKARMQMLPIATAHDHAELGDQSDKARTQMLQSAGRKDRDYAGANRLYAAAFAENGMDLTVLAPDEAVRLIKVSAILPHFVRALDNWAYCKDHLPKGDGKPLRDIAQAADKDPWRRKLREPTLRKNRAALEKLAEEEAVLEQPPELLLILFSLLEDAKAEAAGIRLLKKAQPLHPADFWINYQLANSLGKPGRFREAAAYGRAALAIRPESPVVLLTLADALRGQGLKFEPEAEPLIRHAMTLQPDNPHVYSYFGYHQYVQGKHLEAEAAYRKAIELDPTRADAYSNLGVFLHRQKKFPEAESAYHKAIELDPTYVVAYNNFGSWLADQKKYPEAEAAFRKAIELDPTDVLGYVNFGNCLSHLKKYLEAEAAYRKAIELDPTSANAYSNLGNFLDRQKKYPEAEAACRKAIELDPTSDYAYSKLGVALSRQKKYPKAEAAFRKAIELDPTYLISYLNFGICLENQKKYPEAEAAYRKAIELDPTSADAYFDFGNCLGDQKKYSEAEAAYRKAIELDCTSAKAYSNLGILLNRQKKYPEAEAAYRKAIELDPTYVLAYFNFSTCLADQKKYPEAEAACRKAIELDPEFAPAYSNLSGTLVQQKKFPEAEAACRKAIELDPKIDKYNAACTMAVAGCAPSKETSPEDAMERARYRGQALAWLRAALIAMQKDLEKESGKPRPDLKQTMRHWQQDSDFDGVRGDEALAKLPEAERREWRTFWDEVAALEKRATASQPR